MRNFNTTHDININITNLLWNLINSFNWETEKKNCRINIKNNNIETRVEKKKLYKKY